MEANDLFKLQRYIGKRSLGQTDEQVICHIDKLDNKNHFSPEEWEKLLYPACAAADTTILKYITSKLDTISDIKEVILHTVRFRNMNVGYEKKQVEALRILMPYVEEHEKAEVLNEALVIAAWFGEVEALKYLVDVGGDKNYIDEQGRSLQALSKNAEDKFHDYRVSDYLKSN
jgi:hypothetical protein